MSRIFVHASIRIIFFVMPTLSVFECLRNREQISAE